MRPSHADLKILWIYSYSRASLLEAQQCLNAMDCTDPESPQFRALVCAAVVAYARPFTKSQVTQNERVDPLKNTLPPAPLSATHEMLLNLRNKVIGHKDATPAKGESTTPNIMLIYRGVAGFDLHTIIIEGMQLDTRKEMKALCAHFVTHCENQIHPIITRYRTEILHHPVGTYELLVTEPPHEWIRAHK